MNSDWLENFPGAVTVCDANFVINYMNKVSKETFKDDGGENLIGKNLLDCHNDNSKNKLKEITQGKTPNIYTIEKAGIKKLIYQAPIYDNNEYKGMVELSLQIPFQMEHFNRD